MLKQLSKTILTPLLILKFSLNLLKSSSFTHKWVLHPAETIYHKNLYNGTLQYTKVNHIASIN